jgi:hypothetical protein
MDNKDIIFTVIFLISLISFIYFLGVSITGLATMHCEDGECRKLCRFDSECTDGNCCDMGGYGVCKTDCEKTFRIIPEADVSKIPRMESPSPYRNGTILYLILIILTIIVAIIYFKRKK